MTTAERSHLQQVHQADQRLVAGRYRLVKQVGSGRLGDVYEADDVEHGDFDVGRRVAIQVLHDRMTQTRGLLKKLTPGFEALRAAPHPNIVRYRDFDHDGTVGYLVMDFLEGVSLRFVLDDSATLPLDEVIPVIRAVGDALQFLHAKSIVHRRVTAENVFFTDDLEVRLLDVVPLNSAISIPDGVASGEPFARCDTTDDIYGLACLTYEMLAGTHPFNYHSFSEARHAGLTPARIDSLPERQWNALCRALAFDNEQRTLAVADFLREFGVKGTERLRPSADATPSPGSRPAANPVSSATGTALLARREEAPARTQVKRRRWVPSVFLMTVLAGLSVWYFYGEPRDDVARLIAYVDPYLGSSSTGSLAVGMPVEVTDVPPTVSADNESTTIPSAPVTQPEPEDAESSAATVPASEEATTEPAESAPALIQSVVRVFESDGAAQIRNQAPRDAADRILWWTADDTATAPGDYIPTEQPKVAFASGEETEMLYIPLVNDSVSEPQESFYVYLGQHSAELGRVETIASIRVEIIDDD